MIDQSREDVRFEDLSRKQLEVYARELRKLFESERRLRDEPEATAAELKPESTEGGRRVSILKWPEGALLNLG